MYTIVETPEYLKDAKKVGLSAQERLEIIHFMAKNP
jgi:hypothetical protein